MRARPIATALTALSLGALALTGCSSSDQPSGPASTTAQPPAAAAATAPDISALAGKFCSDFTLSTEPTLYATAEGDCTSPVLTLTTFASADSQAAWLAAAKTFGGSFAKGPGWVLSGPVEYDVVAAAARIS